MTSSPERGLIPGGPIKTPGLPLIAWTLLRIGAVAFGGLGATLALLNRDLVERRGWLRASDVTEALAYTKPLPGSTVVQVVTFLGWRLAGCPLRSWRPSCSSFPHSRS